MPPFGFAQDGIFIPEGREVDERTESIPRTKPLEET